MVRPCRQKKFYQQPNPVMTSASPAGFCGRSPRPRVIGSGAACCDRHVCSTPIVPRSRPASSWRGCVEHLPRSRSFLYRPAAPPCPAVSESAAQIPLTKLSKQLGTIPKSLPTHPRSYIYLLGYH